MKQYSYFIYPLINARGLCITVLFFAVIVLSGRAREQGLTAEKLSCTQKFVDAGMTERDALEASDRKVMEVCGELPKYTVNRLWHTDKDRPTGIAEKAVELNTCYEKFEAAGLTVDEASEATDRQLLEICGTVPAFLKSHRK